MSAFIALFRDSVIISGTLAILLVGTACYIWVLGGTVPQELYVLLGVVVGFFFGNRSFKKNSLV